MAACLTTIWIQALEALRRAGMRKTVFPFVKWIAMKRLHCEKSRTPQNLLDVMRSLTEEGARGREIFSVCEGRGEKCSAFSI